MPGLLPRMSLDPPSAYVAFVERHLDPLRRDASRVVGAEHRADEVYPDVLTAVAARWSWLELQTRLGRPNAADGYLLRAFARRVQRWHADRSAADDSRDSSADGPGGGRGSIEITVWEPTPGPEDPLRRYVLQSGSETPVLARPERPTPPRSSAALRLAAQLRPLDSVLAAPIAEASIAWLHAYATWRRNRIAAQLVGAAILIVVVTARMPAFGT
jgi:hypothetical protein